MATGSITSLGIGSGLDLQDILDQLKEVDEGRITRKRNQKTDLQDKSDAYNKVNADLFSIKSDALNLSLGSNYLSNRVTATDEDIVSATIGDGYDASSYSLEVTQKAMRNSWESVAVSSKNDEMFATPASGIADADTTAATTQAEILSIDYGPAGEEQQIDINLASGLTLLEITDEINNASSNLDGDGNQLVTASFHLNDNNEYYIRISDTAGGNTEASEINVAGFDWVAADTTVSIGQGDETMYLSIPPGTTYAGMENLINGADSNTSVTASLIDNGDSTNPYQLVLTADDTGEDARLTLSNLDSLTEVTGAGAASLDAEFKVNGISYQRQNNASIKDVIPGVTLELKNIGESTLNIETDYTSVKEDILSMVEGFNSLISYIKGTDKTDETAEDGSTAESKDDENDNPLEGSSSANRIVYQLRSLLTTMIDLPGNYRSLTDLGLEISSTGTISFDEDILDQAIASDPDAVKSLFIGDEEGDIIGIADLFNDTLTDMVSSTGIASTEIDEAEARISRIDIDIENESQRLTKKYETMAGEFARLDTYISSLNSQANALTSMIEAFNNTDKK